MSDIEVMRAMASLYKKKAAVMQALEGGMSKTGENTHFKYKFVEASAIKRTVGQLFAAHGISLQMSGVATETTESANKPILRIQFAISLCDVDTGAVEQSFWFGEAEARDDKAASKAATSALKYYLISNLMIADKTEDKRDTDRSPARRPASEPTPTPATPARATVQADSTSTPPSWWTEVLAELQEDYNMNPDTFAKFRADVKSLLMAGKLTSGMTAVQAKARIKQELLKELA